MVKTQVRIPDHHNNVAPFEPLSLPASPAATLDGWLAVPVVSTIAGRQLVECSLEPSAEAGTFAGTGDADGLLIHRKQTTGPDSVEVHWRAGTSRALRQISLRQTVALDLAPSSYVIAPGAVYAGNRFLVSPPHCSLRPTVELGGPSAPSAPRLPRRSLRRG